MEQLEDVEDVEAWDGPAGMHDFDFLLGSWTVRNWRRTNALHREREGVWEEFAARPVGTAYLDGHVSSEHYEGTMPGGERCLGLTIRTFDPRTQQWSIRWLDNRQPPDFRPLVGRLDAGVGRFCQVIEGPDGQPLQAWYMWDEITAQTARWQQAFSFDWGEPVDTNWVMELSRAQ